MRLKKLRLGVQRRNALAGIVLALATGLPFHAMAETFEVKMLNRGEKGPMVFEPDFLEIAPGDRVRFVPTHKSHNAATIDGMVPEGAEGFKSRINDEFETAFDRPGFYGIKCSPHYGMGMVMLIKVGALAVLSLSRTYPASPRKPHSGAEGRAGCPSAG